MSIHTEDALREALAFDPQTPSLDVEPIIASVHRHRRRSMWVGSVAASAVLVAGGVAVATWSDGPTIAPVPAGVTTVSGTFEVGRGWEMVVDGQGLCLTNEADTVYSCGVHLTFREGTTFSWSHGESDPQIYAWVVRGSTATASLEKPMAGMIPADVYRVAELDVSIAVVQWLPQDPTGWERLSRDDDGTVTDAVPFHVEASFPTQG